MIKKSSTSYPFSRAAKKTNKNILNKTMIETSKIDKYKNEILNKPKGGFKFSKVERFKTIWPETPGPGQYETNISFGKGPKYSINTTNKETQIHKAIRLSKKNNLPGPCNYTITNENLEKTILHRTISCFFSKQHKLEKFEKPKKLEDNENKKKEKIIEKYLPEVIYNKIIELLNKGKNDNEENKIDMNKDKKIIDIVYLIDSTASMGIEVKISSKLVICLTE